MWGEAHCKQEERFFFLLQDLGFLHMLLTCKKGEEVLEKIHQAMDGSQQLQAQLGSSGHNSEAEKLEHQYQVIWKTHV